MAFSTDIITRHNKTPKNSINTGVCVNKLDITMETYTMAAVDVEAGMTSVYQTTVEPVKPAKTSVWKIIAVITLLVMSAVASSLFTWQYMVSLKPH